MATLNYQDIGELTAVDPRSIGKAIIVPAKEALRQLRFAASGNLTIRDNMYAAIITLGYQGNSTQTLTSGVEYTFQNPLKTKPVGFTQIKCIDANGVAMNIVGANLNTSRTDGMTGITAQIFSSTGYVGESFTASLGAGSATALANGTAKTFASMNVPPGDWMLFSHCGFTTTAATTGTRCIGSVSLTTNTLGVSDARSQIGLVPVNGVADVQLATPMVKLNNSATQTVFGISFASFSGGNVQGFGSVIASRASLVGNGISGIMTGILWGG